MKVVVASGNKHKIEEIAAALAFAGWEFVPIAEIGEYPEPEEPSYEVPLDRWVGELHIQRLEEIYDLSSRL